MLSFSPLCLLSLCAIESGKTWAVCNEGDEEEGMGEKRGRAKKLAVGLKRLL